jgi:hypothetical protein
MLAVKECDDLDLLPEKYVQMAESLVDEP